MKQIKLTQGYTATVDVEDADLCRFSWHVLIAGRTQYARRKDNRRTVLIHRVIMERMIGRPLATGEEVDHIDGCGLNNSRSNLRLATREQNCANKLPYRNNRSGHKGVYWSTNRARWIAAISAHGVKYHLGAFRTLEKAAEAYKTAARHYLGEWARF